VTKKFPDYLKLHREEPPTAPPEPRDIPGLDAVCHSFFRVTGWQLRLVPEAGSSTGVGWSMPIEACDGQAEQLVLSHDSSRVETASLESVRPLAEAIGQMAAEIYRSQSALWQREAELAAGIPVTIRTDEKRNLAHRLESVLRGGAEAIGCQAAALYLLDDATSHLKLRACWQLPKSRFLETPRPLRGAVADLEALVGHAVALEDTSLLPHWKAPEDFPAALCVPVSTAATPLGTLWFFADRVRQFTSEQTQLAEIIAGRLVSDLEREVLVREGLRSRKSDRATQLLARWQDEQRPRVPPLVDGWQVAGRHGRADRVGGQMYDWCILPDGQIAVAVGQAEGSSVEAALTATSLHIAWKSHAVHRHDARQMLDHLNESLWTHSTGNRFASLFYAVIGPESGEMQYASAGDMHALVCGGPEAESLVWQDPLLGLDPDTPCHQISRVIGIGESLVLFSRCAHNVLEAGSDEPEEARVIDALRMLDDATAEEQVNAVFDALTANASGDRTVVVVRRVF
jgi:serine phosphatase RsbU (regulator of sigma subunit)